MHISESALLIRGYLCNYLCRHLHSYKTALQFQYQTGRMSSGKYVRRTAVQNVMAT